MHREEDLLILGEWNKQDNSHMLSDILQSDVSVYFFKLVVIIPGWDD
jgi:hypothetical protein